MAGTEDHERQGDTAAIHIFFLSRSASYVDAQHLVAEASAHPGSDSWEYLEPPGLKSLAQKKIRGFHVPPPKKKEARKPAEVWCNLSSGAEMVPPGVILSRLELLESSSCRGFHCLDHGNLK